jgi:hypothetical protein
MKLLILYTNRDGEQAADVFEGGEIPVDEALTIMRTYYHVDETKPMFVVRGENVEELTVLDTTAYELNVGSA